MIVYAVIAFDRFYPCPDNVVKVFTNREAASAFLKDVSQMVDRDYYELVEYKVEDKYEKI